MELTRNYVGSARVKRLGERKWREHVAFGVNRLISALQVNDVVIGGGNAKNLKKLPLRRRTGDNAYALCRRISHVESRGNEVSPTASHLLAESKKATLS